ncbi:MAG: tRNA (adenosine(37)-N6)-threonylcarbamoyltransferase complex transferase subunit TsaD [Ignavibacteria bacterium]|nr:tRNA (adenosine(37)-N6)-threonylcarbamoyltransferase complex transferase subunit TsaD [Ignavibacteria bacterium]
MNIVAFETSCDETSVAVLRDGRLAANIISSQDFHTLYGGVVPELSSRAHIQRITPLLKAALEKAEISLNEIDIVAATAGPGLIGALMIGFTFAKGLALSLNKPFVPVNHVEGHIFSGFLMPDQPEFPFLCLVVSGGHTMFVLVESFVKMRLLGSTIDDAAGEAFDKVAKLLDLGYPGGPKIQQYSNRGNQEAIKFPIADVKGRYDVSYSGLKTAVLRFVQKAQSANSLTEELKCDIAAGFQATAVKTLTRKLEKAIKEFKPASLSLAGGVAANKKLRDSITSLGLQYHIPVRIPSFEYCGDNGAMIAFRAYSLVSSGEKFTLEYEAFPSFFSSYIAD